MIESVQCFLSSQYINDIKYTNLNAMAVMGKDIVGWGRRGVATVSRSILLVL